jgi:dCTP deaminase
VSVLTGPAIAAIVERTKLLEGTSFNVPLPAIDIEPFDASLAGPNSYDVRLGDTLLMYDTVGTEPIDPDRPPPTRVKRRCDVPTCPCFGATAERVELHGVAAMLTGRSSLGRLGIDCHISAGLIDDGFAGNITLEIRVIHPVIVWPGMRFAQLVFSPVTGERNPYRGRYQNDAGPVASRFHHTQESSK